MNTWIRRLPGERLGAARALVVACGLGYVLLQRNGGWPPEAWVLSVGSVLLVLLGGLRPLTVALAEAVLLVLAETQVSVPLYMVKASASVALFEVVMRRWGRPVLVAVAALVAAYGVSVHESIATDFAGFVYKVATVVGGPVLLAAYIRSLHELAKNAEERAAEAERRREMADQAARMSERAAIARELHDVIAHHMASMVLRVGVARHVVTDADPQLLEVLDDVHAGATTALADLRRLVSALRDPAAMGEDLARLLGEPAELPVAIAGLVDGARQSGLSVAASVDPALTGLDAVRGLTVLRLVQEGLTNVVKHAGLTAEVTLGVQVGEAGVRVEICNERGVPSPLSKTSDGPGHGLPGLRERVALVNGSLEAAPTAEGWRLVAVLPKEAAKVPA